MKSMRQVFLIACVLLFASNLYAADAVKIGYVDLSRLFDEYYKTKDYDVVLESKHKDFEKERTAKIDAIKEAESKLSLLASDKKSAAQDDIDKMKTDLVEFDRQKKNDLTKERNEKIREILLEIEKVVSDYATSQNFTMILNDRVLIYGNKTLDLTEPVLSKLNGSQPKK